MESSPAAPLQIWRIRTDVGSHRALRKRGPAPPAPDPTVEPLHEQLTERELQVLRLLATGLSSTQVAEELFIAVSTARSYIKVIYRKLDVHSRDEAITRARQLGLL